MALVVALDDAPQGLDVLVPALDVAQAGTGITEDLAHLGVALDGAEASCVVVAQNRRPLVALEPYRAFLGVRVVIFRVPLAGGPWSLVASDVSRDWRDERR